MFSLVRPLAAGDLCLQYLLMPDPRPHIFDLTPDTLTGLIVEWGMPRFRADQVLDWVYQRGVIDPAAMTNLAKADRQTLTNRLDLMRGRVIRHQSATDGTQKLLVDWRAGSSPSPASDTASVTATGAGDGPAHNPSPRLPLLQHAASSDTQTECVMIPTDDRRTACISSQIGCPVGCRFCASGLGGLDGNLTTGQIVQQVWQLQQLPGVERITNIVFMGMGEPLANFEPVTAALHTLTAPWGMGLSARRITVSTVGLPAQIRRLAGIDLPITLAISLHAPNDDIRRRIIPWAQFVTIEQLTDAGRFYFDRTGREVTLEYILLGGINDQPEHARELAVVAKRLRSNINLIRFNEVQGLPYQRPEDTGVYRFQTVLRRAGINCHIRASRGRDIAAACGQLRHEHTIAEREA